MIREIVDERGEQMHVAVERRDPVPIRKVIEQHAGLLPPKAR
jgi:hypothetical protein